MIVLTSFLVDLTVAPAPLAVLFLVSGAIWGMALLLFALAVGDGALGVLGACIVLLASGVHVVLPGLSLLLFGVLAGGAMASLGAVRVLRTARPE